MEETTAPDRFNRELSWLAFNGRVLQEAEDEANPLFERLAFLSIFTSNLEEFFRVRVAGIRSLQRLKKKKLGKLGLHPGRSLRRIHNVVAAQQLRFGEIFRTQILPELDRHGIRLIDETGVTREQGAFLEAYYREHVADRIQPVMLDPHGDEPFLRNRVAYLVVELWPTASIALSAEEPRYVLVEIPSPPLPRFVTLPPNGDRQCVMFLDDVIRYNLPTQFEGWEIGGSHAVKLTRDAQLYIEDEFNEDLIDSIRKAVKKRETGVPSSFQYDLRASHSLLSFMKKLLRLEDEDLVVGGRYLNLHDLKDFPRFGKDELCFEESPVPHRALDGVPSVFETIREKDRLLHFPYHSYAHVVRFLTDAAKDPDVEEIWITVYRVSRHSEILTALEAAARRGKSVRVFVELKARFDEEANLQWAERMERAGIVTLYSMPGLKVHAKAALVVRREGSVRRRYAYLGTGNFNEETALVYTDWGLLTADPRLTEDVDTVFHFLAGDVGDPVFHHCLVAPFTLRPGLMELIGKEIRAARRGRESRILAKMNSLEDGQIIDTLYEASRAGVPIQLLVRGICCLVPGLEGHSETIEVRSILDRHLEHGRAFRFEAGGAGRIYLGSADWMQRNLDRRIEVVFPLYDPDVRAEVERYLRIQLSDNVKARCVDAHQTNEYVGADVADGNGARCRAQTIIRQWICDAGALTAPVRSGRAGSARPLQRAHSSG